MILQDEYGTKRLLGSTDIAANSDAQDQSMNDNSTLDSDAKDRNINNDSYTDSLMIAKNVMILHDKKQCVVSCLQIKAALHQLIMLKKKKILP